MSFLLILGTRPEIIKLSPVIRGLESRNLEYKLVHTGQHNLESLRKSLKIKEFDHLLNFPPESAGKFKGNLIKGILNASKWSLKLILQIKKILRKEKPEHLIYQGDTLSIACASLAGKFSRRRPRLSHIEAGIRTYNWFNPFPEEISRRIADRFSDFLFAPTELAKRNLLKEHVNGKIVVTGNTVVDATLQNIRLAEKIELALPEEYGVVFIHRQENVHFSDNLKNVLRFLKQVECEILFIEHPSAVQKFIDFGLYGELLSMKHVKRISLQDYLPFLKILKNAQFVLSDSGGIQEEACTLKFPCIVWRKTTERPEAVESGAAMLVGDDYQKALELVDDIKNKGEFYRSVKNSKNPFGDGKASERILDYLENQN